MECTLQDTVVYTDGSAQPNPGRAGAGVRVEQGVEVHLLSEPVGMASAYLAELCAVRCAFRFLLSRVQCLNSQAKVIVFIDNLAAVRVTNAQWFPTSNVDLCLEIHTMLSKIRKMSSTVLIHWLPAHKGVLGNESVDELAKQAAHKVKSPKPIPGQPPIPYKLARGILRTSM